MNKILLIQPPWQILNKENLWRYVRSCYPSIGLLSIAAVLQQRGHKVKYLDMNAENMDFDEFEDFISKEKFDFIGITATTPLIGNALKLAEIIKKHQNAIVILGGVHPTIFPDEVLGNPNVDLVVRGEGEYTMLEIVEGKPFEKILGLSYKKNGKIVHNQNRPRIENLDELPMPAYNLLPIKKYRPALGTYKKLPAMMIITTRGCPGRCTFCYKTFPGKVIAKSPKKVIKEIKYLVKNYGIKEIQIYDDTFTALRRNVIEFCNLLLKKNIKISWCCFTRANFIDEELLQLMKKAGCHLILLGVESGNQEILNKMKKDITLEQIEKAVKICKKVGIEVRASYMFGCIGETKETLKQTLDFAMKLDTDYAQFNVMTPYPGTEVWKKAKKNGWLKVKNYNYNINDLMLHLPTVSKEEVIRFYKKSHRKYYLRPRILLKRLLKIRNLTQLKQAINSFLILCGARYEI